MGFLRSVRDLQKQAKEIDKTFDPGAQMAQATAQMAQASEMMAQQTRAAGLATTGLDATATVTAVRQTGAAMNLQPVIEIDMTVLAAGRPPYPATARQVVSQVSLPRVQPGASLPVKVDPQDAAVVWVDV